MQPALPQQPVNIERVETQSVSTPMDHQVNQGGSRGGDRTEEKAILTAKNQSSPRLDTGHSAFATSDQQYPNAATIQSNVGILIQEVIPLTIIIGYKT